MTKEFPIPSVEDRPLYDLIWMRHALPVTALALEIGLFDHLAERPASIAEIAAHYQVTPRATEAVVAVLAALNFLQAGADGRFPSAPPPKPTSPPPAPSTTTISSRPTRRCSTICATPSILRTTPSAP